MSTVILDGILIILNMRLYLLLMKLMNYFCLRQRCKISLADFLQGFLYLKPIGDAFQHFVISLYIIHLGDF